MTKTFDAVAARTNAYKAFENSEHEKAKAAFTELIQYYEQTGNTQLTEYLEMQFDLHFVQVDLDEHRAAIDTLKKLRKHFDQHTDPTALKPGPLEVFVQSWVRLGLLQDHVGDTAAAIDTFHACIPKLIDLFGEESPEVITVKGYLKNVQNIS
jgi:hypothetical protein